VPYSWSARLAIASSIIVFACGDEGPALTDGGSDAGDGGTPDGQTVARPTAPALPVLTPCFEGFVERSVGDGTVACAPWPGGEPDECESFEAHFPGRPGCERVGTVCPLGGFAEGLPATGVWYVRAGAMDGDGSVDAPFGSVSEAVAASSPGDTVAIAVGTYTDEVVVDKPLHFVGACAESTVLRSDAETLVAGVITVGATDVEIENLQLADSERSGIWIEGAHDVSIHDVVVDGTTMIGIDVEEGATVDITRVAIRDVARTTLAPVAGFFGRGINVESSATVTVESAFLRGTAEFGILSLGEGTTVGVERVAIVDTTGRDDGSGGVGLMALDGGELTARGVVVLRAQEFGAAAINPGSSISLEDAVVRQTKPQSGTMVAGRAFGLQTNASGSCARCLFEENHEVSTFVHGGTATFSDLIVASTLSAPDTTGRGFEVSTGAEVSCERVLVTDAIESGIIAGGAGTRLTLRDVTVTDIAPFRTGQIGRGMSVQLGASVEIERGRIADVYEHGILVASGELSVTDMEIRRVQPAMNDQRFGRGIAAQIGGSVTGVRVDIEDTYDLGLLLLGAGPSMLGDLRIVNAHVSACADDGCAMHPGGHGLGVYDASAEVDGILIDRADVCGVHVAADGDALLRSGVVKGSAIGACVQSDVQDVAELQRDVSYVDNDLNLETTNLPVPEPIELDP
jgi:hypothetical protein